MAAHSEFCRKTSTSCCLPPRAQELLTEKALKALGVRTLFIRFPDLSSKGVSAAEPPTTCEVSLPVSSGDCRSESMPASRKDGPDMTRGRRRKKPLKLDDSSVALPPPEPSVGAADLTTF